jgi:hypothetical protein
VVRKGIVCSAERCELLCILICDTTSLDIECVGGTSNNQVQCLPQIQKQVFKNNN